MCVQPGVRLPAWVFPMCSINSLFLFLLQCFKKKKKHNKNIQKAFLEIFPFSQPMSSVFVETGETALCSNYVFLVLV